MAFLTIGFKASYSSTKGILILFKTKASFVITNIVTVFAIVIIREL